MKKRIFSKIISDTEMEKREGHYYDKSHYHTIINTDYQGYKENGELLFYFKKNIIPDYFNKIIADSFRKVAMKKHDNRGASSGLLSWDKMPNYVGSWINSKSFRTHYTQASSGKKSKHYISNLSPSNIIGYFEKKDRNKPNSNPCRLTAFSLQNQEKWNKTIPFFNHINNLFQNYVPDRHAKQMERAKISNNYRIGNSCFSTVTVNYSWRTACHKDKGDYEEGFGNLVVIEDPDNPNIFEGCYLGFPQYGVCINIRKGDFLALDVHEWHCNTEFEKKNDKMIPFGNFSEKDFKNEWYFNRIAIVSYLRKNMIKCTS